MQIDNCEFPDDLYYDTENDVWLRIEEKGDEEAVTYARVGISAVRLFLAGKITKVRLRNLEMGKDVAVGKSLGTIESPIYFGAIRSPLSGRIAKLNLDLEVDPKALTESPYNAGWIAEFESFDKASLSDRLALGEKARDKLEARIHELRVKCFKILPDDHLISIGTECATTLANLNELLAKRPQGTVVHLVTDDPTSDIEMIRWSDQTRNELVETRKEQNLYHFIVRKS